MTTQPLSNGATFAGRYRVVRHIAAGGMGDVYEVVHLETDRSLALKVMRPYALGDDMSERFRREARVTAKIRSEHLVEIFDAGVDKSTDMPFLVMELLEGEDVGARLERAGRFSPGEVVTLLHQTALAIDKMHRAGVVHRDLKPENIFLTERDDGSPRAKVLDFGIAKILVEQGDRVATTSEMIGTPLYMAPEQFRAGITVSPASDIYSLAMVAYTMIVGVPYWKPELEAGASLPVLASIIMRGLVEPASARASRVGVTLPRAFNAWLSKATAPSPVHRFSAAQIAVAELADALGVPRPARPEMPPSSPREMLPIPSLQAPPSAPDSKRAELSSANRPASSPVHHSCPVHHSFAATLVTPAASPREAPGGRRLLTAALAVSMAIGVGVLVARSRSSSSTALASDTFPMEPRVAAPSPEVEMEPRGRASGPPETQAPAQIDRGPAAAGSQEPPAISSKKPPKSEAASAAPPSTGKDGAAAPSKKSNEGTSTATQKQSVKKPVPYRLSTPE